MDITEKTRKILWGRSGNRCAICRKELVIDETLTDDPSIVGEECHIHSKKTNGPRYDKNIIIELIDKLDNLILLCNVHHKQIDDQCKEYTADKVREIKKKHEEWVREKLNTQKTKPVRIRRIDENIPSFLRRISSGKELVKFLDKKFAISLDHDESLTREEADIISYLGQTIMMGIELWYDFEVGDKVHLSVDFDEIIKELDGKGFWVFIAEENQVLEGGIAEPSDFPVLIVNVLRKTNSSIINIDLSGEE